MRACQQPCIDIECRRIYWASTGSTHSRLYLIATGLVIGYFLYYYSMPQTGFIIFQGLDPRQMIQLATGSVRAFFCFVNRSTLPRSCVPLVLGLCTAGFRIGRLGRKHCARKTTTVQASLPILPAI